MVGVCLNVKIFPIILQELLIKSHLASLILKLLNVWLDPEYSHSLSLGASVHRKV